MSVECQVHVKSQSELDIGGRKTCDLLLERDNRLEHKTLSSAGGSFVMKYNRRKQKISQWSIVQWQWLE